MISFQHPLWEKNAPWIGSSLILERNLASAKFLPKLTQADMVSIRATLIEHFPKIGSLKSPSFSPAETTSPLDKEYLFEHFLCLETFQNSGAGQGFIIDESENFLALINIKNHLQLQLFNPSQDLLSTWNRLNQIDTDIGQKIAYAFSPKWGYLTSDPSHCGTALKVTLYLHLPALIHTQQLHEALKTQNDPSLVALGLEGDLNDLVGDFLLLKNRYTLGLTEEEILNSLQVAALQLIAKENALSLNLKTSVTTKDLIGRAFGLLKNSYQLQTKETFNALSALKLGLDLGWITGITAPALQALFFQCRRAHLARLLKLDTQELARPRAEWIQKVLQGIEFKI
jgi:protein arginine kinase